MAIKATNRKIIPIEYLDSVFVFTVRFLSRSEVAEIKARQAEVLAIREAAESGNLDAVKELRGRSDLLDLADHQAAEIVIRVDRQIEKDRREPVIFELEDGREATWEQMTQEERIAEVKSQQNLFHLVWGEITQALGAARILGK